MNALFETWTGGKLFIAERYAQGHVILFWVIIVVLIFIIWFEDELSTLLCQLGCFKFCYQVPMS